MIDEQINDEQMIDEYGNTADDTNDGDSDDGERN